MENNAVNEDPCRSNKHAHMQQGIADRHKFEKKRRLTSMTFRIDAPSNKVSRRLNVADRQVCGVLSNEILYAGVGIADVVSILIRHYVPDYAT